MSEKGNWQFWVDRGGTFTDIVARTPEGILHTAKLLSSDPRQYDDAALAGIRRILGIGTGQPLPAHQIEQVKMGTTVATNALLERKGAAAALLITRGFGDALRLAYQNRPRLFDLKVFLPDLLYQKVIEVDERVSAEGEILRPLDLAALRPDLQQLLDEGISSVAIVLLHSYAFPRHEQEIGALCQELGFKQISLSCGTSPLPKLVARGDTTVADAYLSPILRHYVDRVSTALGATPLYFMQSNGGLAAADRFQGKDAILSGPAGGVVGAVKTAALAGFDRIIGFDMGGTSTDVCHFDGDYERTLDTMVAGTRIRAPMLDIHTVAAGGGSIIAFDGQRLRVGPASAGAVPGPACYGKGGPLAVTDANVVLGRIDVETFPKLFGPSGRAPLDAGLARGTFQALARRMGGVSAEQVAEGAIAIAVENMARAVKRITLERGHNVSNYTLVSFGGAGGQHACAVADRLGIATVFLHPLAGVLSALGIGLADSRAIKQVSVEKPLDQNSLDALARHLAELEQHGRSDVAREAPRGSRLRVQHILYLRYQGSDSTLAVPLAPLKKVQAQFETLHQQRFGFSSAEIPIILSSAETEVVAHHDHEDLIPATTASIRTAAGKPHRLYADGRWRDGLLFEREGLAAGQIVPGPALITEAHGATYVASGWQAALSSRGDLILKRGTPLPERKALGTSVDPVQLEIFNNLFMSIAEQMGAVLENTAQSVNMKERLDFSCALFDQDGQLVANAPHVPVHLGSMSESVADIMRRNPHMQRGDVYVTNAPYAGGTHLPDITVITPFFAPGDEAPLFYVASRGHHADIGGISPGSVPPHSTDISEEGALLDNLKLVSRGNFQEQAVRSALTAGRWPARNPDQNIADLKAQIAANARGVGELRRMLALYGRDVVCAYMQHVQDNAAACVQQALGHLSDGSAHIEMDCGAQITVSIRLAPDKTSATLDFTGTSGQMRNNFNAPLAITKAAVLYVFRCLVQDDIPLNAGCLRHLNIVVPDGCLLNPRPPAAVVAGNVETSQAIVDALFQALGVLAGSQGTMNNVTFGDGDHQYYETLAGGMGAGNGFDGASGIQVHMTNSRLTDPEILEARYPVLMEDFRLRTGSGGDGTWHGGDGVVRRLTFRADMTAAILSSNRQHAPKGLNGGGDGQPGRNVLERVDGSIEELDPCAEVDVHPGDTLIIETPGGGGFD